MSKSTGIFDDYLETLYHKSLAIKSGAVFDEIPGLTSDNSDSLAIVLVTPQGHLYEVGDSTVPFTLQSISNAFIYGMALQDYGSKELKEHVGVEPSGEAYNQLSLDLDTHTPKNPMINSGAITITSLLKGDDSAAKLNRVINNLSAYAGEPLKIDHGSYLSEKWTSEKNQQLTESLKQAKTIKGNSEEVLERYIKHCAIGVNCRQLAIMAATLANQGVNPCTGTKVLDSHNVEKVLSVMSACGMNDASGDWMYEVGMPAKSGISGGIMAVLPGRFGIAVFSPRLNKQGNSVRGTEVCRQLSATLGLHLFNTERLSEKSIIRSIKTLKSTSSKRIRSVKEREIISQHGDKVIIFQLLGEMLLSSTEIFVHTVLEKIDNANIVVVDFNRVSAIDIPATKLLAKLAQQLEVINKKLVVINTTELSRFDTKMRQQAEKRNINSLHYFASSSQALNWCEDQLLIANGFHIIEGLITSFDQQELVQGFSEEELIDLEDRLECVDFRKGETICTEGGLDKHLYFLISGNVNVTLAIAHRRQQVLATFAAGSAFGEMAIIEDKPRSATVTANSDINCMVLDYAVLDADTSPIALQIKLKFSQNLAKSLSKRLRSNNNEIRALSH